MNHPSIDQPLQPGAVSSEGTRIPRESHMVSGSSYLFGTAFDL